MKCKICNAENSIYSVETVIQEYRICLDEEGKIDYVFPAKSEQTIDRDILCNECGHEFNSEEELL